MAAILTIRTAILNTQFLSHGTSPLLSTLSISSRRKTQTRARNRKFCLRLNAGAIEKVNGGGGGEIVEEEEASVLVRIVALVGEGSVSPIKNTPWEEVMTHTDGNQNLYCYTQLLGLGLTVEANRLKWVDEGFHLLVFSDHSIKSSDTNLEALQRELARCDLLVNVAVNDQKSIAWIQKNSDSIPNVICFETHSSLGNKLGGSYVENKGDDVFGMLADVVRPRRSKEYLEVVKTVSAAWDRHNSDDIRFCLLVIINAYIKPVPILKNLRAKGLSTLGCMLKNCGAEVVNCLFDPNCRKALQCLNSCSPTDQVCNYRCIASYESPYLEAFSLCVLQKNNCLELDAEIPSKPFVPPLSMFRGEILSQEIAEDLFVGWLGTLEWSWRVVAGQNPAYDQFPCQYQLFYRGKARGSFWYEPVFQVTTLDEGKLIWRRRRYRVRRGRSPGTFHFSVLDNGVVSKEFWTIVDVSDDFSWGLFHYSGAAEAAGQSYAGAVLVSPDGMYPFEMGSQRMNLALEKCGIKEWELYTVDNCSCEDPPLGIPEGSSLHSRVPPRDATRVSKIG